MLNLAGLTTLLAIVLGVVIPFAGSLHAQAPWRLSIAFAAGGFLAGLLAAFLLDRLLNWLLRGEGKGLKGKLSFIAYFLLPLPLLLLFSFALAWSTERAVSFWS